MNGKIRIVAALIILITSACSIGGPQSTVPDQQGAAQTQQAAINLAVQGTATTSALQTQISSLETQVAQLTASSGQTVVVVTATPEPAALTPTATEIPPTAAYTATSTATPQPPTATAVPPTATFTATNTPIPCNLAKFEGDITVSDGTTFLPGTGFTKTWRLRNTGSCTWTTAYDLVFVSGDQMGAPSVVDLPGNVLPGQVIDLSVSMTAPNSPGSYRGNWKLRDSSGNLFGVGKAGVSFYVDIKVSSPSASIPYDMASLYCTAEWSAGDTRLPCPGTDNDSRGFVMRIDKPTLESGYVDDEPVLLTHPQMITDGVIRGKFPAIRVENGYHFNSTIGCAYRAEKCDVKFRLDYQIGSDSIQTLGTWHEVYEGKFRLIDVDLSSLAGKDVKFILTILSNGSPADDRAQWLKPQIVKK